MSPESSLIDVRSCDYFSTVHTVCSFVIVMALLANPILALLYGDEQFGNIPGRRLGLSFCRSLHRPS